MWEIFNFFIFLLKFVTFIWKKNWNFYAILKTELWLFVYILFLKSIYSYNFLYKIMTCMTFTLTCETLKCRCGYIVLDLETLQCYLNNLIMITSVNGALMYLSR